MFNLSLLTAGSTSSSSGAASTEECPVVESIVADISEEEANTTIATTAEFYRHAQDGTLGAVAEEEYYDDDPELEAALVESGITFESSTGDSLSLEDQLALSSGAWERIDANTYLWLSNTPLTFADGSIIMKRQPMIQPLDYIKSLGYPIYVRDGNSVVAPLIPFVGGKRHKTRKLRRSKTIKKNRKRKTAKRRLLKLK
jgi:hypothetical protein